MPNIKPTTEKAPGACKDISIVVGSPLPLSITTEMAKKSISRATVMVKNEMIGVPTSNAPVVVKNETVKVPTPNATVIVKREMKPPIQNDMEQKPSHIYQQRKYMLNEYKELFSVLMRFSDKEISQKVVRCLNAKYANKETQTDPVEILETSSSKELVPPVNTNTTESTPTSPNNSRPPTPKKRKRRRKVAEPQANKESRVAQRSLLSEKSVQRKPSSQTPEIAQSNNDCPAKRRRSNSVCSNDSTLFNMITDMDLSRKDELYESFIKDCIIADVPLENGLLPIYDCIVRDQDRTLKTQILIWKEYKRVDLNELITDDDEDLLQLAINNNRSPPIIKLLLTNGLRPNSVDCQGNNIIHLCVLNDLVPDSMDHLMSHIDLKMLLELNNDGYTCLQLAVRQDNFLLAECILNGVDKRLSGSIFYTRNYNKIESDEKTMKLDFKDYYKKVCQDMIVEDNVASANGNIIKNSDLKQKLLQVTDVRSGSTALFFAIENQSEHLIYFLLAHLSDPRTENLSGQDCKTFFNEFGKSLKLSLDIDSAMERVIQLLS